MTKEELVNTVAKSTEITEKQAKLFPRIKHSYTRFWLGQYVSVYLLSEVSEDYFQ